MKDDLRKHPRRRVEVAVDWKVVDSTDVIWSTTGDASAGGLRIRTMNPPAEGTEIALVITGLEGDGPSLEVGGRVAWVRMNDDFCGMGIQFLPEDPAGQATIERILGELTGTNHQP